MVAGIGFMDKLLFWWRMKKAAALLSGVLDGAEREAVCADLELIIEALERIIAVL